MQAFGKSMEEVGDDAQLVNSGFQNNLQQQTLQRIAVAEPGFRFGDYLSAVTLLGV